MAATPTDVPPAKNSTLVIVVPVVAVAVAVTVSGMPTFAAELLLGAVIETVGAPMAADTAASKMTVATRTEICRTKVSMIGFLAESLGALRAREAAPGRVSMSFEKAGWLGWIPAIQAVQGRAFVGSQFPASGHARRGSPSRKNLAVPAAYGTS